MAITNIQTVGGGADITSRSLSITDGSGSNRFACAIVTQFRSPVGITGATLNGVAGTQAVANTSNPHVLIFYWLDADLPALGGSYTIATVGTAGTVCSISGFSCSGAAQSAPGDTDSASASAANASLTLTVGAGGVVVVGAIIGASPTTNSGQTSILAGTLDGPTYYHAASYDTADGTVGYTHSSAAHTIAAIAIEEAPSGGLSITSVTPSSFDDGRTGIVIAGSGFGASQGSSTLTIGGQAQTVTAWSDTSITFTSVRGSNSMGTRSLTITKG